MSALTVEAPQRRTGRYELDTQAGRLSPAERAAKGKAARADVPRSSHAGFTPAADRPDPVDVLEQAIRRRLPDLVPIRYGRMLASPFSYYRGAALPMAHDLSGTPVTGLAVQACGDAHLANFGMFASAERRLIFDINDFDETLPGPWEWDVKRLAASIEIAARENRIPAASAPRWRWRPCVGTGSRWASSPACRTWASATPARTDRQARPGGGPAEAAPAQGWPSKGVAKARPDQHAGPSARCPG